jgi:hypothetical protein
MSSTPPKKDDVVSLFQSGEAADMGLTKQGSDILIQGLNGTNLPMCVGNFSIDTIESDDVTVVFLVVDASPSMEPVRGLLIETINDVMINSLKGASKKSASEVVVGGLAFSTRIWSLWNGGFHHLKDLPDLTPAEYDPSSGNATNLYEAMKDGITAASAYAINVFQQMATPPKVIVVTLTDGANNVGRANPGDVKLVVESLSRELYTFAAAVFETWEHVDGEQIARDSGFEVFEFKKQQGETTDDVRKRFRHMIGVLSSSIVSASQAKVGSSQAFWTGADQQ